jgi:hypothetical protein
MDCNSIFLIIELKTQSIKLFLNVKKVIMDVAISMALHHLDL